MNPLNPYFCRIIFTFLILILLSPIISLGEILKLKSGGVLNGEIVSESKTEVTIITRGVKMIIQKQNIESTTHEPEDIKYIRRGELATKNGKYYEAYTDYTTALGLNPNNALAHKYYDSLMKDCEQQEQELCNRALQEYENKNIEQAMEIITSCINTYPMLTTARVLQDQIQNFKQTRELAMDRIWSEETTKIYLGLQTGTLYLPKTKYKDFIQNALVLMENHYNTGNQAQALSKCNFYLTVSKDSEVISAFSYAQEIMVDFTFRLIKNAYTERNYQKVIQIASLSKSSPTVNENDYASFSKNTAINLEIISMISDSAKRVAESQKPQQDFQAEQSNRPVVATREMMEERWKTELDKQRQELEPTYKQDVTVVVDNFLRALAKGNSGREYWAPRSQPISFVGLQEWSIENIGPFLGSGASKDIFGRVETGNPYCLVGVKIIGYTQLGLLRRVNYTARVEFSGYTEGDSYMRGNTMVTMRGNPDWKITDMFE